jgi:hypothetical protein
MRYVRRTRHIHVIVHEIFVCTVIPEGFIKKMADELKIR